MRVAKKRAKPPEEDEEHGGTKLPDAWDFETRDVFRNRRTGELHVCGVSQCTERVRRGTREVCRLTNVLLSQVDLTNETLVAAPRKVARTERDFPLELKVRCEHKMHELFCGKSARARIRAECRKQGVAEVTFADADVDRIVGQVMRVYTWLQCQTVKEEAFLFAVLHCLSCGFKSASGNLCIRQDPALALAMPPMRLIHNYGVRQSEVTQLLTLFKENAFQTLTI